jgi:tetratricopeptide (TPR) repeat protein
MKIALRCPGWTGALLLAAAAWWGTPRVAAAGSSPAQAAPPVSPPAAARPQEITLEQRGDIMMARKNYDEAVDYYYRALKQSSFGDPALWNKIGIADQQESKFHDASKAYSKATHADRSFAEPWNNLGTVFFMEKRYRKSVGYYRHAIELKGEIATFHMNLGSSYYHLKKYRLAVQEYRTALQLDPSLVTRESAVGTVVDAGGTDAEYYFYMAKALASVGNAEVAVRYLRRALEDGFTDRQRIDQDPDFKKIRQLPAFVELMRNPPVAIKE